MISQRYRAKLVPNQEGKNDATEYKRQWIKQHIGEQPTCELLIPFGGVQVCLPHPALVGIHPACGKKAHHTMVAWSGECIWACPEHIKRLEATGTGSVN